MSQSIIPNQRAETRTLISLLMAKTIGDVLTYQEASDAIRMDVQKEARGIMSSAIRSVQNQHGQEWISERGVGYRLLADKERVFKAKGITRRISRASKRGRRVLKNTDDTALSFEMRAVKDAERIRLEAVSLFSGSHGEKKSQEIVLTRQDATRLPTKEELIRAFS